MDEAGGRVIAVRRLPLIGREHKRKQGCWNCTKWDSGAKAANYYAARRLADAQLLLAAGWTLEEVMASQAAMDRRIRPPLSGLCMAGGAGADFVAPEYLCAKWNGVIHIDGVQRGGRFDPQVEEIRDKIGDPLKVTP